MSGTRVSNRFVYSSGTWDSATVNACLNDVGRETVGVAMRAKHNWMTGLVKGLMGGDKVMTERTVMQFEPLEQNSCKPAHAERAPVMKERSMKRFLPSRRRRDEIGATAILVAMFFSFIALPLGAVTVDVARLYVELERVQAAADAAATAGVTFMPDDFVKAKARAIEIAEDNGFPNSGTSSIQVSVGAKPTQLKVTVSSKVKNAFARSFGVPTSTMTRTAVADFNGPAPMGSPCNTYGNEPAGASNRGTPSGSVLSKPPLAQCDSNPEFWSNIGGPTWPKGNGDQFMTRTCSGARRWLHGQHQ